MPNGPLDPNRLLSKAQDASSNPGMDANFDTHPVELSEGISSFSKSSQKSEPGDENFFNSDDLYLDDQYDKDFSFW